LERPLGAEPHGPATLRVQPVEGGAIATVPSLVRDFTLSDGVLAWSESTLDGQLALKASTATTATTLRVADPLTYHVYTVTGGHVLFSTHDGEHHLYDWNSATGALKLLFHSAPRLYPTGKIVYFTLGNTNALHKLELD
jgi:outer membrane protein assembly factor BamB